MNDTQQQAELIAREILQELKARGPGAVAGAPLAAQTLHIPVGISNRHVHLSREDMDILFGYGATHPHESGASMPPKRR